MTDGLTVRSPGLRECGSCVDSRARRSPFASSTLWGSVNAANVPQMKMAQAPYSGHGGPMACSPAATGAAAAVASRPASVTREFALTSENFGGSSRGTTALRTTPYALDATSTPSAAG